MIDRTSVLITGGAGFLGRNLARALLPLGYNIRILDPLLTRCSHRGAQELSAQGVEVIAESTRNRALLNELMRECGVVFHLGSVVGVEMTMNNTIATMKNLEGTINLAEAATPDHVVIFTSSADVYGIHSHYVTGPMREDDPEFFEPARVNRWVYGRVKGLEENAINGSAASSVCVRVFNSYGPGMDYPDGRRVIPSLVESALATQRMRIAGQGTQRRSFCFIEDTIEGLLLAMRHASLSHVSDTVNIGHDRSHTILEAAEIIAELCLEMNLVEVRPRIELDSALYSHAFDDSWNRVPDLGRANRLLGYRPRVDFEDGLRKTLAFFAELQPLSA